MKVPKFQHPPLKCLNTVSKNIFGDHDAPPTLMSDRVNTIHVFPVDIFSLQLKTSIPGYIRGHALLRTHAKCKRDVTID